MVCVRGKVGTKGTATIDRHLCKRQQRDGAQDTICSPLCNDVYICREVKTAGYLAVAL